MPHLRLRKEPGPAQSWPKSLESRSPTRPIVPSARIGSGSGDNQPLLDALPYWYGSSSLRQSGLGCEAKFGLNLT
ncbi:uncharacterized protein CCOS01_12856 [Colletotrichum costaricense]|uniref:Uncharacterized protein n=2 Tax=Colletotrichum acutatum species complex TaxID=2707335 RepID=A0AAI9YM38_9PEZI|nr:uncharacterized protein CCOS01_12856 [Colletotrichum costaricense]XP_060377562.1 uncharacterized protein CTAM01_11770 [Colletotrichum tamarilloi]KAK1487593.1 hypothetical protein CTAM01_11770 [Colletotrichum tamarilloi]KAK1515658.1 hypothetical protein CCOS01_12856 [Colletotrichum costaricense]